METRYIECYCKVCNKAREVRDPDESCDKCKICGLHFMFWRMTFCGYCGGAVCDCCKIYGSYCTVDPYSCMIRGNIKLESIVNLYGNLEFVCSHICGDNIIDSKERVKLVEGNNIGVNNVKK